MSLVELTLADEGWIGTPVQVRARTDLVEDGLLVVEIKTEGVEKLDIEVGGVVLSGGTIRAEASASLSPGEARIVAAELLRLAEELDEYRAGFAGSPD